jgi:dienelactone hydrolase
MDLYFLSIMHDSIFTHTFLASAVIALAATALFADPASTRSSGDSADNGWDASFFGYKLSSPLVVEETTPTRDQADWQRRPAKFAGGSLKAPVATKGAVRPYAVENLNVTRLRFRDLEGADVPALLVTPADRKRPEGGWPVVIALHGLNSHKAQVVAQVAPTLARQGFAVLAPDLPLHGERPGNPHGMFDQKDLRAFVARAKQSIQNIRLCVDVAEQRADLDTRGGVLLAGYSMGAIMASVAGPADPRIKGMCLMVGGTVDLPPVIAMIPQMASLSPQLAIAHFTGRPVLMLNAKQDHIITPEMGERLFAAAPRETTKQVWYDSGHMLPTKAYEECAKWAAETWGTLKGDVNGR